MFLLLISTIFLALVALLRSTRKPHNYPPGPSWKPIVGSLPELKKICKETGSQHEAFKKLAEKFSTNVLGLKLGKDPIVVVFSYELLKKVLNSEYFVGRPDSFFIRLRSMGTGKGVTMTDGHLWYVQKKFLVNNLRDLGFGKHSMELKIKEELMELIEIIEQKGCHAQIGRFIAPSIINVLWSLISGDRIDRTDARLQKLLNLLSTRTKVFDMAGGVLGQYPWLRYIAPERTGYNLILKLNEQFRDLFMETIQEHHRSWTAGVDNDFIYAFITEMKKQQDEHTTFTSDQLLMMCMDLFIGGSQTTSNTLDFAFLAMVLHPEIQAKVQNTLDEKVEDKYINYTDRLNVPYVEAVLMEVQRYYLITPITGPRRALRDIELEGYNIPKDTTILLHMDSVHMDKEYWHDPETFRPERFLDGDEKLIRSERLLPFGGGKRRCIGEVLARHCIFIFFANIMKNFSISVPSDEKMPTGIPIPGLTISPEEYRVNFLKRC